MNLLVKDLNKYSNKAKNNNFDDLACHYKHKNSVKIRFADSDNAFIFLKQIKDSEILLESAKTNQNKYKSILNSIRRRKPEKKFKKANKVHYTILICFKNQEKLSLTF